jgi:ABC-type molybdate transport system substrate-binding protein
MRGIRLATGILFLAGAFVTADADAAELKLLSVDTLKPALAELQKSFEASSKDKLKIDYASSADVEKKITAEEEYDLVIVDKPISDKLDKSAKIAGGSIKTVTKQGDKAFTISVTNFTQEPRAAQEVIKFLESAKAKEVYKAKGMEG